MARISPGLACVAALCALTAGCGGDDDTAATPTAPVAHTEAAADSEDTMAAPRSSPVTSAATPADGPAPTSMPDGMGAPEADGVFPRTMTHFKGTTTIEAEPSRIVVIGTGQLDVLLTLGIVPVGAVQRDGAAIVQPYLVDANPAIADQLAAIPTAGTNAAINLEQIAALQPDLIFDNGGAGADEYGTLAEIAPTVITEGTGVNWKQDFLLMASALGRTGDAEAFMAAYNRDAAALAEHVASDPPTVSFVRFNPDRSRIFGIPSFVGSIAWDAGLKRPESQRFDETSEDISEEQIELVDADWLFYGVQGAAADTPAAAFVASPLWANLTAVSQDHVTLVEDDPFFLSAGPTAARIVLDTMTATLGS